MTRTPSRFLALFLVVCTLISLAVFPVSAEQDSSDLANSTVTLSETSYTCDGTAKCPDVTVTAGDAVLTEGTDYTVTYAKNVNYGTASATVTAVDGSGYTGSKTVSYTISALSAPTMKAASCAYGGVQLTWSAVDGADAYRVYRKTSGGSYKALTDTDSASCLDTTAESGTTYAYTVRCLSADGTVLTSKAATGISVSYLAAPVLKTASNTTAGVKVTWGAVTGAVNYVVCRKTDGSSWKKLATTTSTSYTDTTAESGTTYTYTVRCATANGKTMTSAYDPNGISVGRLSTPTMSSASNGLSGVTVKWSAVTGAENYRVYRKTSGGSWKKITDTTSTSYTDTTVESGTTYFYTVRCISADGSTVLSDFDSSGISVTYISAPVLTSVTNAATGVKVSWTAVDGAENYVVCRKTSGSSWKKVGTTTDTSYTDTTAESGTTYYYTVRCVSEDGKAYTSGYDATGLSVYYIAAPTLKSISAAATKGIVITWEAPTGAENYVVCRKTSGGSWKKIATTTSTKYTDTSASTGTTYYYTVRCVSEDGTTYTSGYNTTGLSLTYCAAPTITSVTNASNYGGAIIKWGAVTGAENYRVFRKESEGSWKAVATTTGTNLTDTTGLSGVTYTYTVRCFTSDGKTATSGFDGTGVSIDYTGPYTSSHESWSEKSMRLIGTTEGKFSYDTEEEAEADMAQITVKTWDFKSGSSGAKYTRTWTISVHKGLEASVKKIFDEIYNGDEKFPIHSLGGYDWRGEGSTSEHSIGTAIDINWDENPMAYVDDDGNITEILVGTAYEPGVNPYSIPADGDVVNAFAKYGFDWGDWGGKVDYMHFSYFGT